MMKHMLVALACCVAIAFAAEYDDVNVAASSELTAEEHRLGYYGYGRPYYYSGYYRRPYYYYPKYSGHYRGRRSIDDMAYPEPAAEEISTAEVVAVEASAYDQSIEESRRGYYSGYYHPHRFYSGYHSYRPYHYGRPYWGY